MLTWNLLEVAFCGPRFGTGFPSAVGAACGALAGLIGITPACGYVSPMWAFFIGAATAFFVFFTPHIMKRCGREDRLDCFAFHCVGGITGSLLTGELREAEVARQGQL